MLSNKVEGKSHSSALAHEHPAVFGIYTERNKAELAIELLKLNEFKNTEISVLWPHNNDRRDIVALPATKALQGAEIGGGAGAVIGGVLGWLSGIGLLAVPGAGAVLVAGPIGAILFAATTGAGLGALLGALSGMGVETTQAEHFYGRLHKGDILLSVHCEQPGRLMRAKELLVETGAEDVYSPRHPQPAKHLSA